MKRFQGRIPLVNTFGKASLHPVDGTPVILVPARLSLAHFFSGNLGHRCPPTPATERGVCRRSEVLSHWRNNAMERFQGRIPLVNTFGKASLHPVDGIPVLQEPHESVEKSGHASREGREGC